MKKGRSYYSSSLNTLLSIETYTYCLIMDSTFRRVDVERTKCWISLRMIVAYWPFTLILRKEDEPLQYKRKALFNIVCIIVEHSTCKYSRTIIWKWNTHFSMITSETRTLTAPEAKQYMCIAQGYMMSQMFDILLLTKSKDINNDAECVCAFCILFCQTHFLIRSSLSMCIFNGKSCHGKRFSNI